MRINERLAGVLAAAIALSGISVTVLGCNKKDEETEEEDSPKKKPEPEPEPAATASAQADALGDVETYPEMTKAGGTYRMLRPFQVYRAADESSKRLTGIAPGTLVDFKFFYRDWIMIDWPSGPGQLSPGWIHLRQQQININTKREEKPDAGKPDDKLDAGAPDAGKKDDKPDAGKVDAGPPRLKPGILRKP